MLEEKDELHHSFFEETRKLQRLARDQINRVLDELEMLNIELENKKKRLDSWSEELKCREELTERKRLKLEEEKPKNDTRNSALQLASDEQRKADENVLRLVEKHQREKEEALKKILELERNLDEKQKVELEIKELNGMLEVMKHVGGDDDVSVDQKINQMKERLQDKKENLESLEDLKQQLLTKERLSNDELQEVLIELIENDTSNSVLQLTSDELRKADENVVRLAEEQQREKEEALQKILDQKRNLDEKHKVELEIEGLNGMLEVIKHMGCDDDATVQQKINQMKESLQEKKENLKSLEDLNQQFLTKERQSNDELPEALKELIEGSNDMLNSACANIGIKRMGEIVLKAFKNACKERYSLDEAEIKAVKLYSLLQEKLKNPDWHPFRIVEDSKGNAHESVLREDDELLVQLKEELGDEVYDAIATAFKEIQEYNPSGCYVVSELWNNKENRKATLKEVISCLFSQLKNLKRKRN